jgi:hypothetical protein
MDVAIAAEVPVRDANADKTSVRAGTYDSQRMLEDDAPDGFNFWVLRNNFVNLGESAFNTPRHHHPFAQIKYLEKGSSNYVPGKDIPEGAICYFPRSAWYGPQVKENCISLSMQFGFNGEHQRGKRWESRRVEAMDRLRQRGSLDDKGFIFPDPATGETVRKDPVDAIYEERYELLTGKKFVTRPEGYDAPILLHPEGFIYFDAAPGVELKHLGAFYDQPGPNGDCRISMVRLTDGGTHQLGSDRPQVAWSISSGLQIDGRTCPAITCVYSPRGEEAQLTGVDGVEVVIVEFPRLD